MFFKKRKYIKITRFFNKPIYIHNLNIFIKGNFIYFKNNNYYYIFKLDCNILVKKNKNFLYLFFLNFKIIPKLGPIYSLINNIIIGLTHYFLKKILLLGVGYKFILKYNFLIIFLGFSHPIVFIKPKIIKMYLFSSTILFISSYDKQFVNLFGSKIKKIKKFDLYKGKGIKYINEFIKLKIIKKK